MRTPVVRTALSLLAVTSVVAACGSASSSESDSTTPPSTTTTTTTTTTPNPAGTAAAYAEPGPYGVGYTTLELADGRDVVVWYPAEPGPTATDGARQTIDYYASLRADLQAKIPQADRVPFETDAYAEVPAASLDEPAPLVVYSHGYGGWPEVSASFLTLFASWGFVVAAPDHVERSGPGMFGTAAEGVPPKTDLEVLEATIDRTLEASSASGPLEGLVDPERIVATGESAGAGAAYGLASADDRVDAWISYSVGFGGALGTAPAVPNKPGMVMLAADDGVIPPAATRLVYDGMVSPKYLVEVADAGHALFTDLCLMGGDGPHNLVRRLPTWKVAPDWMVDAAQDGCEVDRPKVSEAFPAIDHLGVAFFRSVLGIDPQPVGLDTEAVADLGTPVTVTAG